MAGLILLEVRDGATPVRHRFEGSRVRVGRATDNDLVLEDASLSRAHLEFRAADGRWMVEDLGSRHGSTINGRPLLGSEVLRPGDELRIGSCTLLPQWSSSSMSDAVHAQETSDASMPASRGGTLGAAPQLVGSSATMRALRTRLELLAASDVTVLLRGEPGTGKEMAARLLHAWSPRARGPFVVVNCPAVATGLFEAELFGVDAGAATDVRARPGKARLAAGGTLFLDEIGDLDPISQAKLLRFCQDKTIDVVGASGSGSAPLDVRIVAATNRDLEDDVRAGRFRRDLYDRIQAAPVALPPLRDRREDLPELISWFVRLARPSPAGITPAAVQELCKWQHGANVRGLEGAIQAAAALAAGTEIDTQHLPREVQMDVGDPSDRLRATLLEPAGDFERDFAQPYLRREISRDTARALFRRLLGEFGTRTALASALRVSPKRVMNVLREHELNPDER